VKNTLYSGRTRARPPRIFACVVLLVGLALAAGGIRLTLLGGSLYYVTAGIALLACGALLWQGNRWGSYLYGLLTAATVAWAMPAVT